MKTSHTTPCPCTSGKMLDMCCEPFLSGKAKPKTAEALMRSRYTAYALQQVAYIGETHDPKTRSDFDEAASRQWSESVIWTGLDILSTEAGGESDETGVVEFVAHFDDTNGKGHAHKERATFRKEDGQWYFIDGDVEKNQPVRRTTQKIGRNDPCSCGSGKKYKKCCGRPGAAA